MARLLIQRLLLSFFVLALVSVIVFVMVELLPGDAATAYLGRMATPDRVARLQCVYSIVQGFVLHGITASQTCP